MWQYIGREKIEVGPAFYTHSKFNTDLTPADRAAEHRDASQVHAEEVEKVRIWAETIAEAAGVPLIPDAPLIGPSA